MPKAATSRAGWTTVAFGDVVRLSTERSSNPESDGFERFVGLEHIEPGDLRIRRWGDIADGTTFTSVFRPGQVLFGKRRAYQRKVAVADFSGVCSGDIYVLEPKGKDLLPELLPFICQTDAFFEYAVGTSAGSLSPRTNWTSLSGFQFALPPIEEQRRLSNALTTAQRLRERVLDVHERGETVRDSLLLQYIDRARERATVDASRGWEYLPLGSRYEIALGKMLSPTARVGDAQVPYIRNANVQWGRLDLSDVATMSIPVSERERFALRAGDILACEGRHVGKSVIWNNEIPGACYQKALHRLRPLDPKLDVPQYLLLCLRLYSVTGRLVEATGETTIPHLPAERFRQVVFPFPPRGVQESICEQVSQLDQQLHKVKSRADSIGCLLKSIASGLGT